MLKVKKLLFHEKSEPDFFPTRFSVILSNISSFVSIHSRYIYRLLLPIHSRYIRELRHCRYVSFGNSLFYPFAYP